MTTVTPRDIESKTELTKVSFKYRTSKYLVETVMDTSVGDDWKGYAFYANTLVNDLLSPLDELSNDQLTQIETLLTCHFISLYDPVIRQETAGPVNAQYHNLSTFALMGTPHGQMACVVDTTGTLAALHWDTMNPNKRRGKASVTWVGNDNCED